MKINRAWLALVSVCALCLVLLGASLSLSLMAPRDAAVRRGMHQWFKEVARGDAGTPAGGGAGGAGGDAISEGGGKKPAPHNGPDAERAALDHEAEEDRVLREATDLMQAEPLRRAIAVAMADKHESSALRTAKFVLKHLTDERTQADASGPASDPHPHTPTTHDGLALPSGGGGGGGGDGGGNGPGAPGDVHTATKQSGSGGNDDDASDFLDPVEPDSAPQADDELPLLIDASPQKFDWWSHPAPSLAALLPPMPAAAHFAPVAVEAPATAQARFDAIVSMAQPQFRPERFPIGVVAFNRPALLQSCLASLLNVTGVVAAQITLYQDGSDPAVAAVARAAGVAVRQHLGNEGRRGEEGAMRIARHYRWTFTGLFDANPAAAYAIIVEDDMIFSPDFMLYFVQTAPLYERDPSVYAISSWNDNGQRGMASDPRVLMRTDFFIGLGWMISREIYKKEWEPIWPTTHWDHFLRDPSRRRGRQTIYPEVSRNYNTGRRGTHSDDSFYERYFAHTELVTQPSVWLGDVSRMHQTQYDAALMSHLHRATQVSSLRALERYRHADLVLFLDLTSPKDPRWEKVYAPYFGLFHSVPQIRGMYQEGVLRLRWHTNYLALVAGHAKRFASLRRPDTLLLGVGAFAVQRSDLRLFRSARGGESCSAVCRRRSADPLHPNLECSRPALARINECASMQKYFRCKRCDLNWGTDQPAYVHNKQLDNYGSCLINSHEPDCEGSHPDTTRLCACVKKITQ